MNRSPPLIRQRPPSVDALITRTMFSLELLTANRHRRSLIVKIVAVADGSVLWSHAYPSTGADPATIATDVNSKVQSLEDQ